MPDYSLVSRCLTYLNIKNQELIFFVLECKHFNYHSTWNLSFSQRKYLCPVLEWRVLLLILLFAVSEQHGNIGFRVCFKFPLVLDHLILL